jgi:hypothetical protein
MGRAMLIIIAGVLISLGFVTINTSNQGLALTQKTVNYAEYTMAKNAAHTAIQIAMQEINKDDDWPNTYSSAGNAWVTTVQGLEVRLHTDYIQNENYWEPDMLWLYSRAQLGEDFDNITVEVRSHYLKQPFSSLVPDFEGALTVAADPDKFTFSMGGSSSMSGNAPDGTTCEDKPAITTIPGAEDNFSSVTGSASVEGEPKVATSTDLSYQPTDEMIARLAATDGVQFISGNYKGSLGTKENPGVFFVEDNARLTGGIDEGYGILVVRSHGELEYEGEDGATLDVAGNFKFNGLVIFENAYNFTGRGTPTINGSVLVGHTETFPGHEKIDIDLSGNIHLQYDCRGEDYAKMAAAQAVKQNKYTRVVSTENFRYASSGSTSENEENSSYLIDIVKGLL